MSTTIESLELEILSSSKSAESGLDKLTASLEKLKVATKGGLGLGAVANQIKKVSDATNGISGTNVDNVTGLAKAIQLLGGTKISSTIATQITAMSTALNGADFTGGAEKMRSLVDALAPLSNLPKANLASYVNNIKRLPEALNALDDDTISALTDKIQKLAVALKPLGDEMQKVANGFSAFPAKIQRLIANTNSLAAANNKASTSYINLWAKLKMAATAVKSMASKIGSAMRETMSYYETINLFSVSMGKYAIEAYNYAEKVSELMGIDPAQWMKYQGTIMTLATGFGIASDRAYTMSQQLTQLAYDISSFREIGIEEAMQKIQSGFAGELEPLRAIGYDLSQAKLEAVAFSLGIDKSVSSMTQAEKAQLRYYAIMTQVTMAQGDMAKTLDSPANQLRIFKAQVTQAARAIGSIFIPALNAVLPYAIAVAKVIRILAENIASLFGYEMPEVEYSGVEQLESGAEGANNALDDAANSAKKLKSYMLGFDELNVINPNEGQGDDLGETLEQFNFKLPAYDFIGEATESRVSQIVEDMKEWLGLTGEINSWADLFDTNLGKILKKVGKIAIGIAAWKLTKAFLDGLATFKAIVSTPSYSIALSAAITVTGIVFAFEDMADAIENGLDGFNFAGIVGNSLLGAGGAAWLGSTVATWITKSFGGSAVATALTKAATNLGLGSAGAAGAAIASGIAGIILGIPTMLVGIYDACKNGIDWLSGLLIPIGATAAGAGVGTLVGAAIGSVGGPLGAGIGALIGLAVGLITDGVILIVQNWEKISDWFESTFATIGQFFVDLWDGVVAVWSTVAEWFDTNVISPIANFFSGLWEGIVSVAQSSWDSIVRVVESCWKGIKSVFSPIIEWFGKLFSSVYQTISDVFYNIGVIAKGCWEVIRVAWKVVAEWFDTKVITPVANFFSTMWTNVKKWATSAWDGIKTVFDVVGNWMNTNVIKPVANFFSGMWTGFLDGAKSAWNGVKTVFNSVATFFKDIFTNAWQGVVKVFSVAGSIFVDIKDGIVSAFKRVVNGLIGGLNKVIAIPFNGINTALNAIKKINILGITPFEGLKTISIPQIPTLAEGGFPDLGQMFIAREAGPELVGTIGSRSAVVNNDQIVESVSAGVYQAVLAALGSGGDEGGDTQIVINLDGEKIYENQQRVARNRGYNLGMGAFSFG